MLSVSLPEAEHLHAVARERDVETCAVGLVHLASAPGSSPPRYVVHELIEAPPDAYTTRTAVAAVLKPEYCTHISNRGRAERAGILIAHTHPGLNPLEGFSRADDEGESALSVFFRARMPSAPHFAAVFTQAHVHARRLGDGAEPVMIRSVGRQILTNTQPGTSPGEAYDRQVRAFGLDGQSKLAAASVAIVGLGGTGSVVAQQLAHLGVSTFVLIDPDVVEATNLNRLLGAVPKDVGSPKVTVAAQSIKAINPGASVTQVEGDVTDESVAGHLTGADFIFGCTDSMASRAIMNQIAYQFLVPYIDVGVGIYVRDGAIEYITGRTQMMSPGLPCLVCTDKLDAEQVRRELLTEEQRRADPYITGASVPQPAVISLNSIMSSAAVTMFLAAVTGIRSDARMLIYDGVRGSLRPAAGTPRAHCIVCSTDGALGRGTAWQLPTRRGGSCG